MNQEQKWLDWAVELQALAQAGLYYSKDIYDLERFQRIREIAADMLVSPSGLPAEQVRNLFCGETGYQTPKLDSRAAIIENEKILLVQEQSGLWSMPGGWVDVTQTIASNTVKEAREEAGLEVTPLRLAAMHDRNRHNTPPYAYNICKVFVLCRRLGGAFAPNSETLASGWFGMDDLPPLDEGKTTKEQIALCFQAHADPHWQPVFD